eukprot:1211688-Lingulodinium_polyedra.AAC.1
MGKGTTTQLRPLANTCCTGRNGAQLPRRQRPLGCALVANQTGLDAGFSNTHGMRNLAARCRMLLARRNNC